MKSITGDIWKQPADALCITTNGTIRRDGTNVMGGGCAREAAFRYPWLPKLYGDMICSQGHHVFALPKRLVMFPTKERVEDRATLQRVMESCNELMALADVYGWQRIVLPRPGCGLGGLNWNAVLPCLQVTLDDRVTVVGYPHEDASDDMVPWPREPIGGDTDD